MEFLPPPVLRPYVDSLLIQDVPIMRVTLLPLEGGF